MVEDNGVLIFSDNLVFSNIGDCFPSSCKTSLEFWFVFSFEFSFLANSLRDCTIANEPES